MTLLFMIRTPETVIIGPLRWSHSPLWPSKERLLLDLPEEDVQWLLEGVSVSHELVRFWWPTVPCLDRVGLLSSDLSVVMVIPAHRLSLVGSASF